MIESVVVERDLGMPTPDGVVLRANVYHSADDAPAPVLLMRTPYGKDVATAIHPFEPALAVERGFVVVVQDVRGRYESDGDWDPYTTEAQDGYAAVQWCAGLPWSNGTVGMYGASYQGAAQLAAASARPPALAAIAPMMCWLRPDNGQSYRGRAVELGKLVRWTLMNMPDRLRRRLGEIGSRAAIAACEGELARLSAASYRPLPLGALPVLTAFDPDNEVFRYLAAADDGAFDQPELLTGPERTVPGLWIAGWFDAFLADMLSGFEADRSAGLASELVVGPWSHANQTRTVGAVDFGEGAETVEGTPLGDLILDWFARLLLRSGASAPAPVRTFAMRGEGWRSAAAFPSDSGDPLELYLDGEGCLTSEPGDDRELSFTYDPDDPVPTVGGATLMGGAFVSGPADQSELARRPDVVTFVGPILSSPLRIEDWIRAELWFGTDCRSTDVVARLVDVLPDGRCLSVTDGVQRITATAGEGLQPVTVDLWATSHVFARGHRVGLQVTSSSFPRWNRNLNTGEPLLTGTTVRVATQRLGTGRSCPSRLISGRRDG